MNSKRLLFFVVLVCVGATLWAVVQLTPNTMKATYSQFLQQVESGQVSSAMIVASHTGPSQVNYGLRNGNKVQTVVPSDYRGVLEALQRKMVNIEIRDASSEWLRMLANATPFLVLLGLWFFMMRRLPGRDAK
jgi:cell division protease FtsH